MITLNISNRSGKWWDNFMVDRNPGGKIADINLHLAEWNANLVLNEEGEQIQFENEQDRVMFLLRYS